jgi:hypothetical protein
LLRLQYRKPLPGSLAANPCQAGSQPQMEILLFRNGGKCNSLMLI